MGALASQITSLTIVYLIVYSDADHRKHQISASTGPCAGNSPAPGTGEFPAQIASYTGNVSIWWRHHVHGWPSTQPGSLHTALQRKYTHCSPGARLCEQWGHSCVNNGARLCASARLCRGSPVCNGMLPDATELLLELTLTKFSGVHLMSILAGNITH